MEKYSTFVFLICLYSITTSSWAANFECPNKILDVSQSLTVVPEGWEQYVEQHPNMFLKGIVIYSGHPKELHSQIHSSEHEKKDKVGTTVRYVWELKNTQDPWMECVYSGTGVRLVRSVKKYTNCYVEQKKLSSMNRFETASAGCE